MAVSDAAVRTARKTFLTLAAGATLALYVLYCGIPPIARALESLIERLEALAEKRGF